MAIRIASQPFKYISYVEFQNLKAFYMTTHRLFTLCCWLMPLAIFGQKPQLVLPIIHQYAALDLEYSADGNYLVSCARTELKLWEAKTGRLIFTIDNDTPRPDTPFDDCPLGFQQVAVAPDGSYIVSARYCKKQENDSHNRPYDENAGPTYIEVWDTQTARLRKQIKISSYRIFVWDITLSPDGQQIALTTTTKVGFYGYIDGEVAVSVWDVETGKQLLERPYEQGKFSAQNHTLLATGAKAIHKVDTRTAKVGASYFLDEEPMEMGISADGQRVFALTEGKLWVWENPSTSPKTYPLPESAVYGAMPFFSKDGQFLTLLNWENSSMKRFQLADGKEVAAAAVQMPPGRGAKPRTAITPNHELIAFAHYPDVGEVTPAIKGFFPAQPNKGISYGAVDIPAGLLLRLFTLQPDSDELKILANGQLIEVEDAYGTQHVFHTAENRYLNGSVESFKVVPMSNDSLAILTTGQVTNDASAQTAKPKISIYDAQGKLAKVVENIRLDGPSQDLYYDPPKKQLFFQVSNNQRRYLDLARKTLGPARLGSQLEDPSHALHADFALSTTDKTSISLFRKRDGVELAKLLFFGQHDWVVATPSGLFDGSDAGKKALHFVNGLEIIPLESYEARYWVPGLLGKLLSGLTPKQIRDVSQLSLDELYPIIKAQIKNDHLIIDIEERSGGLGELHLYINGSMVNKNVNRSKKKHLEIPLQAYGQHFYTQQANQISLQAFNRGDWMKSRPVELPPYTPSFPINRDHKFAHFYGIVVGTSDYDGDHLDLAYAGKDAVSMHQALSVAAKELFQERVDIRLFTTDKVPKTGEPTKALIKKALDEITEKAEPIDLVLVYLAGHGKVQTDDRDKPRFYYLTQRMNSFGQLEDPQARKLDAISQEELTDWLSTVGARKKVMVLDACNSGQLVEALVQDRAFTESQLIALDRMKDRTGMYILAGSAADRKSYEATPFGQGLLTYSILQGMQEISTQNENKEVDVLQLLMHAENQVPSLARSVGVSQNPKMYNQDGLSSFPIGIVHNPSDIPVANPKPVLLPPIFTEEEQYEDILGLSQAMEDYLQEEIKRGDQYTFRSLRSLPNGYALRGRYRLQGNEVQFTGLVFKGSQKISDAKFTKRGSRSNLTPLIQEIFEELAYWVDIDQD